MDVHADDVSSTVASFVTQIPDSLPSNGYSHVYSPKYAIQKAGYVISVTPVPFCSGPSTSTCQQPLPDYTSFDNLWGAWRNCK